MQKNLEFERAFYHLDPQRQSPANPDLLDGILRELGGNVRTTLLSLDKYQIRTADGHLIAGIHPDKRDFDGIIVEAVSTTLDRRQRDVWSILETVTDPTTGIRGNLVTVFSYFEGRDDKESKHEGGVLHLVQYLKDLISHSNKRNSAIAVWDVHSRATLDYLRQANGRRSLNKPEVVSLTAMPLFADRLKADGLLDGKETIAAAPDFGSFTKAREMTKFLGKPLIFIDKERPHPNHVIIKGIYMANGDGNIKSLEHTYLKGKRVVFFDDSFDTGSTAVDLSAELKNQGADEIVFAATHGIFSDRPEDKVQGEKTSLSLVGAMNAGIIDYLYVSDTLPQYKKIKLDPDLEKSDRVRFVSLAKPIAALIKIAADRAVKEDYDIVMRCLYNPGPDKKLIELHFKKGNVNPAYKDFDIQNAVFGNKSRVIFSRQPSVN